MRGPILLLVAAAVAATPATARPGTLPARQFAIDEIAADLAYGFCPLFLAGQFQLTAPELAERGFGTRIFKQPHPRVGEMSLVSAVRPDGEVAFGGATGKACTVIVSGPKREAVLARLRGNMAYMGLDFQKTANVGPELAGTEVETFRAPVDRQMLYVQLIQASLPKPAVAAQLFAMDK